MKNKLLRLTESGGKELKSGFHSGESHCLRMHCRAILLKSEGLISARIGEQTEMTARSVNGWVKRFESGGIKGLRTRPGQGASQ
ncbi:MAG: helix-turn-helix domain-containing protein [Dysgonamonadaceae bacterium]|jgi:putative transposase|nr:helix-turn-helix domain-containing protein [Dysgonamonadaceae bacterium]